MPEPKWGGCLSDMTFSDLCPVQLSWDQAGSLGLEYLRNDPKGLSNDARTEIALTEECCLSDVQTESAPH